MKRLLNTLYILSEDCYLSLKNENVQIYKEDELVKSVPLKGIESIILFSYKGASPKLLGFCHEQGIGVSFLTPQGRFLTMPSGRSKGNVLLRKEQYRISDDPSRRILISKSMIAGKVYNARSQLKRMMRSYPMRIDTEAFERSVRFMTETISDIRAAPDEETLRGIEGKAANAYFSIFDNMILNQKEGFSFTVRSRRPPLDRINAMLSFGYTLLGHDCAAALEAVGLDSYVGFLHTDRPGRESLAFDLMEELRVLMVDRTVLTMINKKLIKSSDFRKEESGAVYLDEEGKKKFIEHWQDVKKTELLHPYLKEKISWGLVPHTQALLLSRYIRGDYDAYPVFLWE